MWDIFYRFWDVAQMEKLKSGKQPGEVGGPVK
jgi:hypothetical protein